MPNVADFSSGWQRTCRDLFCADKQNSCGLRLSPQFFILISASVKEGESRRNRYSEKREINAGLRQVADKSLCHFLVCLLNPYAFYSTLFEFLLTESERKKSFSILMLFVCQAKDVENERKFSPFTHSTSNGLHAHTSWKDFLSSDLIDVENFPRDFSSPRGILSYVPTYECQHFIRNIDLIILKFDGKLSFVFRRYISTVQV
jgi:hypothetical protein